jgi:hypothetical protein
MWICGSYCEWNKHHEEEAWPDFCCSLLLARSLLPSGYIQEGQEVSYDYLLLGVYYRNSPSSAVVFASASTIFLFYRIIIYLIRPEDENSRCEHHQTGFHHLWLQR